MDTPDRFCPPRLGLGLITRFLPAQDQEAVLGDLQEGYAAVVVRRGRILGNLWYLWNVLALLLAFRQAPLRQQRDGARERGAPVWTLGQDVRFGVRMLLRSPGYAVITTVTLATGVGAASAIFSVANAVLFQPLPYPEADRLLTIMETGAQGNEIGLGYATAADLSRDSRSLVSLATTAGWQPTLSSGEGADRVVGESVSHEFFGTLGIAPVLGQDFTAEQDRSGASRYLILSHDLWERRFGGDSSIVGRSVEVSGVPYQVVGVLPSGFVSALTPDAQLWRPLGYEPSLPWACRTCRHLRTIGRLRSGVSLAEADAELDQLSARYVAAYPSEYARTGMHPVPLKRYITRSARPVLLAVIGAVALLLFIAIGNTVNLVLARVAERRAEFEIRVALGAGRLRVARQMVTEGLLLGIIGGGAGLLVAWGGIAALLALQPEGIPRLSEIRVDWFVALAGSGLALGTGVLAGLFPVMTSLRSGRTGRMVGGRVSGSRVHDRTRSILVIAECALAFMLLVGAGLLVRSVGRLLAVDPGFNASKLLTMEVLASGPRYRDDTALWETQAAVLDRVQQQPGVEAAALVSQIPLGHNRDRYGVLIRSQPLANPEEAPVADRYAVTGSYHEVMGIPVVRGRGISRTDVRDAPPVVVINRALASLAWPDGDPIGEQLQMGGPDQPWRTIVGVVGDVQHEGLDTEPGPQFYIPSGQWSWAENAMTLAVRTAAAPLSVAAGVRESVWSVDRGLAISEVVTASELVLQSASRHRFAKILFQLFSAVALVLAIGGIYGVLSGSVTARSREIGIRAALGASQSGILGLIVGQGMRLVVTGLAVGLAGALLLARGMGSLLYGVTSSDPITILTMGLGMIGVALLASAIPAWRAVAVDPTTVLKAD